MLLLGGIAMSQTKNTVNFKIIGYLGDNQEWDVNSIDVSKLTHINYAFGLVRDGSVVGNHLKKINQLNQLKEKNPNLKTLISIGGWGADGFSDAALTEEGRNKFADTAIDFILKNNFDGIDIDWEYPCSSLAEIASRPEDKQNFTLMLKVIREKLDIIGEKNNRYYMLTIAAGAGEIFSENTELLEIIKYLDFINIMTYDLVNGFDTRTGHHTGLYVSPMDPDRLSGAGAVDILIDAGIPAEKLVFGAAFYGRGWPDVDNVNNGFGQLSRSPGGQYYSYSILTESYINKNGYTRFWDDDAKAPYLYNGNTFITYEDVNSIQYKTEYIKSKGLGGVMFWEYSLDNTGLLLNTLYNGLNN